MDTFIQKYRPQIKGSLSGWDRIVFRGFIRTLAYAHGMATYLQRIGCLLKDFGEFAQLKTEQLIAQSRLRVGGGVWSFFEEGGAVLSWFAVSGGGGERRFFDFGI